MNITVYLGAQYGNDDKIIHLAEELGTWIGQHHTLVYGAGKNGLMGVVADAALQQGGDVIGVIPNFMVDLELEHPGCTEIYRTTNMHERKLMMVEMGDAFIALPGGSGTLEEITEIISLKRLERVHGPCIIFNYEGYYDPLKQLLDRMVDFDFTTSESIEKLHFPTTLDQIKEILGE